MQNIGKSKIYNIDAKGKSLGRLASDVAVTLRGKKEVNYVPYLDPLIIVNIANIDGLMLTGKKIYQKIYHHHTGYPGGLKTVKYADLIKKDKGRALKLAVLRMLNKNRLRAKLMRRLIIE